MNREYNLRRDIRGMGEGKGREKNYIHNTERREYPSSRYICLIVIMFQSAVCLEAVTPQ
jgi:hypothetical protein